MINMQKYKTIHTKISFYSSLWIFHSQNFLVLYILRCIHLTIYKYTFVFYFYINITYKHMTYDVWYININMLYANIIKCNINILQKYIHLWIYDILHIYTHVYFCSSWLYSLIKILIGVPFMPVHAAYFRCNYCVVFYYMAAAVI